MGNTELVDGLGVLFDTYDNHQEDHGHPWVSALVGDGRAAYNHDEDGKQVTRGGCQSFFRNMDHPTYVRITYWHDLQYLEVKMKVTEENWTPCFTEVSAALAVNVQPRRACSCCVKLSMCGLRKARACTASLCLPSS